MPSTATLITGATKGIGRAVADRMAARGRTVVGLARTAPKDGFPGEFVAVDLADPEAARRALADIVARHEVTEVVNNVGLVRPQRLDQVDLADFTAVLDLNLRPAVQCAQAALPAMRRAGRGRIVNISSLTVLGVPGRTAYGGAKAALVGFTRTWALELAREGITVNAIAPGPVATELFRTNNPPGSEGERAYLSMVPMGRFGTPDEVAAAVGFLLSDEAGWITGQTLFVDGGASIGRLPV